MMTAVRLVMVALMFGQNVLLHCRQGKHRSGVFCLPDACLAMGMLGDGGARVVLVWPSRLDEPRLAGLGQHHLSQE